MKIEAEIEEKCFDDDEEENDYTEYVSSVSFTECSRKDLEELGKFFLAASKELPRARLGPNYIQATQMFLKNYSERFKDHETLISVSLDIDEP